MPAIRLAAASCIGCILGLAVTAGSQTRLPIAMNLGCPSYYSALENDQGRNSEAFIDYAKFLGQTWWHRVDNADLPDAQAKIVQRSAEDADLVDSNGYALQVPLVVPGFTPPVRPEYVLPGFFRSGDYAVLFDGRGTFEFYTAGYVTLLSTAPGRLLIHCEPKTPSGGFAVMRIMTSVLGDHVRNIRILPVAIEHSYDPSKPFSPKWLEAVNRLSALRFMGWSQINDGNTHRKWKNRVTAGFYSQGTQQGVSYDLQILACNTVKIDGWFNIPHMVDDEYITSLARLLKSKMDPSLKVYIEYSNEIWNWAGGYPQSQFVLQCGRMTDRPEWNAPDSIHNILTKIKSVYGHPEMDAYMMQRVFNIFRGVFTGADRARLVCVAAGQVGWADNTWRITDYLFDTAGTFAQYGSTGGGCDAIAGAPYFTKDEPLSVWAAGLLVHGQIAKRYRIRNLCYEGGSEANQGVTWNASSAVYDQYLQTLDRLVLPDIACDLFTALVLTGRPDSYGHLDSLAQATMPTAQQPWKWQALMARTSRVPIDLSSTAAAPTVARRASVRPALRPVTTVMFSGRSTMPRYTLMGKQVPGTTRHAGREAPAAGAYIVGVENNAATTADGPGK